MLRWTFGNIFETFRGQQNAIHVDDSLMRSQYELHMKSTIKNAADPCHQRDTRFILRTVQADAWTVCHDAVHDAVKSSYSSAKRCIKIQQSNVEWPSPSSLQYADHHLHLTYRVYRQALDVRLASDSRQSRAHDGPEHNVHSINLRQVSCHLQVFLTDIIRVQPTKTICSRRSCPAEDLAFCYEGRQLQRSICDSDLSEQISMQFAGTVDQNQTRQTSVRHTHCHSRRAGTTAWLISHDQSRKYDIPPALASLDILVTFITRSSPYSFHIFSSFFERHHFGNTSESDGFATFSFTLEREQVDSTKSIIIEGKKSHFLGAALRRPPSNHQVILVRHPFQWTSHMKRTILTPCLSPVTLQMPSTRIKATVSSLNTGPLCRS